MVSVNSHSIRGFCLAERNQEDHDAAVHLRAETLAVVAQTTAALARGRAELERGQAELDRTQAELVRMVAQRAGGHVIVTLITV